MVKTDLHRASMNGNAADVERLLKQNPGWVHEKDGSGATPLFDAAAYGHEQCVRLLLEGGADPKARDFGGGTPLNDARRRGHSAVVELLEAAEREQQAAPPTQAMANVSVSSAGGAPGQCDIFGSYKQNDGSDALMMVMHFQLKPLEVWLDKMRGEERSEAGMVAGVKSCRLFCAVISPAYFSSNFCLLEMRTAIQQGKKIALCFNGSKYKVQDALGWIPAEFANLKGDELIMLHEDNEFMQVSLNKLKSRVA